VCWFTLPLCLFGEPNNLAYDLMAGQVFDFTTIDPLGVDCFLLLGIDETELIDPNGNSKPPFVFGATFMNPGTAEVTTFPLIFVEPSDFDQDGDVDGEDFLLWQRDPSVGSLADWEANYGLGAVAAASTTVPGSKRTCCETRYY
jgi:hypothetical protein